ncbi:Dihydroflavonol-4-reductase [Morella rubra]|uniref:Dihydroflavonol-4-reductase n=1 Tax=Morella rubra TaxID=262757 RepID=A0A6A1VQU3_9ROSI|nr:Dihydroflavonol-4-reductase [Morella rubra]
MTLVTNKNGAMRIGKNFLVLRPFSACSAEFRTNTDGRFVIFSTGKSELKEMEDLEGKRQEIPAYCVTGATGYIGSWLVKILLERGYKVHATVRDPAKSLPLLSSWTGSERLRLFQADLQEEGSFDEAVKGCDGVFHVAASMKFSVLVNEDVETHVQSHVIDPAIKGTLNLLKACLKSKSVKRVVLTSSISTITAKDSAGNWRPFVDESCQTAVDHVWDTKPTGWIYALSKRLTEEAAFKFAIENGIDLVSAITSTVAGPFFTLEVPSSIRVLLSPITGDPEFFRILSAVNARMGSIALIHIEDICSAHIFLMQQAKVHGRYICCAQNCLMSKLVEHLAEEYPCSNIRAAEKENNPVPPAISSKKLIDLGYNYKHGIGDIIHQTIASCLDCGFLPRIAE